MPAGEMIALGPKRTRADVSTEGSRAATPPVSSADRKREAPVGMSSSNVSIPKKPKLSSPTPLGKPSMEFPKSGKLSQSSSSASSVTRPTSRSLDGNKTHALVLLENETRNRKIQVLVHGKKMVMPTENFKSEKVVLNLDSLRKFNLKVRLHVYYVKGIEQLLLLYFEETSKSCNSLLISLLQVFVMKLLNISIARARCYSTINSAIKTISNNVKKPFMN